MPASAHPAARAKRRSITSTVNAAQTFAYPLTVTNAGQLMVGSWLSFTITVWRQVAVLPLASVTQMLTLPVPGASEAPAHRP